MPTNKLHLALIAYLAGFATGGLTVAIGAWDEMSWSATGPAVTVVRHTGLPTRTNADWLGRMTLVPNDSADGSLIGAGEAP